MFKVFILIFLTFHLYADGFWNEKVKSFGNLSDTIQYQGSTDSINLQQFQKLSNLYAIGLGEFLQNEILILDSKPYISSVKSKTLQIEKSFKNQAAFLVYAQVPSWESYKLPNNIFTKKQFEEFLEELAEEEGIDTYEAFPFLIEGKIKASRYRVFSHNPNDVIITSIGTCASCNEGEKKENVKKRYLSQTLYKVMQEKELTILGFYSNQKGIITDKESYTNLNFISSDKRYSGHIQNMMVGSNMILKLPRLK